MLSFQRLIKPVLTIISSKVFRRSRWLSNIIGSLSKSSLPPWRSVILDDNNRFTINALKSLLYSIDNFKLLRLQFRITELIRFRKDDNGFGLGWGFDTTFLIKITQNVIQIRFLHRITNNQGQNHWHISEKVRFLNELFNFSAEKNIFPGSLPPPPSPPPKQCWKHNLAQLQDNSNIVWGGWGAKCSQEWKKP